MEGAAVVDLGIGKRDVRDQERDGLGLESTSPYDQHPQKLIRTDTFPFRTAASAAVTSATTTSVASAAASPHLPPLHPSSGINCGRCTDGPTFYYNSGGIYDSYEAAARTLQPFPNSFKSQATGMGSAMALRYPLFTPAQWQELKRQALIYKHFVSSAPIPPDLLFDPTAGPSIPPLYPNLTRGSGYFNLRFTNNTDPEPGRCRRTDGKKWRCSRDVAPDQKYCERHMHRGRPRSRKPVEQRQKTAAAAATNISPSTSTTTTTSAANSTAPTNTATITGVTQKTYAQAPHAAKLPFLSMAPEKEPRYLDWMKGGLEEMHSNRNSNIGLRTSTPVLDQYEEQFKLNYSDLNDPCNSFLNPDLSSLDAAPGPDQRYPPRSFIDAWSNEKPPVSSAAKLPSPSTLTLSMSGGGGGTEDMDHIQMGLSINDSTGRSQPLSWMNPVTTLGGPLAEVLQSGTSTSSPHNSSGEGEGAMSRSYAGLINLMGRSCCGSDGVVSPRDSPPRVVVTSPTGVLQRTFVSLSDSSSNSSPTFGAGGGRSEMGCLQWMSQAK